MHASISFDSLQITGAGLTLSTESADYLRCYPSSGNQEVVLPVAALNQGRRYTVRNFGSTHVVYLNTAQSNGDTESTETIEGSPLTYTLGPGDRVTVQCVPVGSDFGWEAVG